MTYDNTDADDDGVVEADVDNQSVSAESADIKNRWDFESGYSLETTQVTDDSNHTNEPWVIPWDDQVLLIYRSGSQHGSNDGEIRQRKVSVSDLRSNGAAAFVNASPTTIISDGSYDTRNQTCILSNGTLWIHYRRWDASAGNTIDVERVKSTDKGSSYSSPATVTIPNLTSPAPFGRPIQTSNGLLQAFSLRSGQSGGGFGVYYLDGGSWGNDVELSSSSNESEPVPVRITDDKILFYVRLSGGGWVPYKSTDGGQSIKSKEDAFYRSLDNAGPLDARETAAGERTIAYQDRDRFELYYHQANANDLWMNPQFWADSPRQRFYVGRESSRTANFGYPKLCQLGPVGERHILATWYDGDGDSNTDQKTDVFVGSLSAGLSDYYPSETELTTTSGRVLNSVSNFLVDDIGDNSTTARSNGAVGQFFGHDSNSPFQSLYRPPWNEGATDGFVVQNAQWQWAQGSGNTELAYVPSTGVPSVFEWQCTFEWPTVGGGSDNLQITPIRETSNNKWTVFVVGDGRVFVRKTDSGTETDYSDLSGGDTGGGSWPADNNKHFLQVRRYSGGKWQVLIDGEKQVETTDTFLPSADLSRVVFSDAGGGSEIHVHHIRAKNP